MFPTIKKPNRVYGANIFLRDIDEQDADFVLGLRKDPVKSKYLSAISGSLEDQVNWIREYKNKRDQAYFIVCDKLGNKLGCIRMYEPMANSYCWGSWLMISGLSVYVSIESALLIFSYGKYLGFDEARINVRQDNEFVWKFHEKFCSAELVGHTELDRFYIVHKDSIDKMLIRHSNLITSPLYVENY